MIGVKFVDGQWKIVFVERYRVGQKLNLPKLELPVLVLHGCPVCRHVIRVYFRTDRTIPAWRYAEVSDPDKFDMEMITVPGGMGLIDKRHVADQRCYADNERYSASIDVLPYFDPGANMELVIKESEWRFIGKMDKRIISIGQENSLRFGPDMVGREAPVMVFMKGEFENGLRYDEELKRYAGLSKKIAPITEGKKFG